MDSRMAGLEQARADQARGRRRRTLEALVAYLRPKARCMDCRRADNGAAAHCGSCECCS